ncbi:acetyl-CoA acetyltransferase [Millisia brevis]|uniref:acetyl-CoA acetyltransferase n=1 Tax=Millisia brevis TaxID=264148 RepID=UPI00083187B4|nr:acetyl-CoA acetyltransferase [Millisia brevis]
MTLDPRTPVLVGGGQINQREGGVEPVDLIVRAARAAADDAAAPLLAESVDSIRVVGMLSWYYRDPGALVGERLGAAPRHTGVTGTGGNMPQSLVNAAALDIAAGRADVVLIGGAETWRTWSQHRRAGTRQPWTDQPSTVTPAEVLVPEMPLLFDGNTRVGLIRPSEVYPLFEQALRLAAGRSPADHRDRLGRLWSRFSSVAAKNPDAWIQREFTPAEIVTPGPDNRLIADPYTKLMNANNSVEQGAAVLICSVEAARRYRVPQDRWVFPLSGTDAHDTFNVAERGALDRSPAIAAAGRAAIELAGTSVDAIDHLDVYSCFPSAVQVAAAELGLPVDDPARPLTITGGLSFAGGPWNNYVTHAIATMITTLREHPDSLGMVTANGGFLTKHAFGVYGTRPPAAGFRYADVQSVVDAAPTVAAPVTYEGPARIESWTVTRDRDGAPERVLLATRTPGGARAMAFSTDADLLAGAAAGECAGSAGAVAADGRFTAAG